MTDKEYNRLGEFLKQHNGKAKDFHGWFMLFPDYALKHGIAEFQHIDNLSATKSSVFRHPAKNIKTIKLWVSYGGKQPAIYF